MSEQDQEITLGTGRLLGLFFGLVIVCALFFSLGFSLGRKASPEGASTTAAVSGGAAVKSARGDAAIAQEPASKTSSDELTFYKAVEQNEPKARLEPPSPPATAKPERRSADKAGAGFMVQVAAVRKQEDAEALVSALRKKSYPVINNSATNDKLFHVQVGPFADLKLAEAARAKLIGDGYNPILKK